MPPSPVTKHFNFPFKFDNITGHAAEVEQDTLDDVVNCVEVAFLVEPGYRLEVPTFGVPSQVFNLQPLNLENMIQAVQLWEARAEMTLGQQIDPSDITKLTARVTALVSTRTASG